MSGCLRNRIKPNFQSVLSASHMTTLSLAMRTMGTIPCFSIDGKSYSMVPELQQSNVSIRVPSDPGGSVRSITLAVSKIPPEVIIIFMTAWLPLGNWNEYCVINGQYLADNLLIKPLITRKNVDFVSFAVTQANC
jgi:hypothetical protein